MAVGAKELSGVYRDLGAVVRSAKQLGFRVTMITNGLLVDRPRGAVVSELDGMAISFDGLSETHDRIRARQGARLRLRRALRHHGARRPDPRAAAPLQGRGLADFRDLVGSALATLEDRRELVDWFEFCTA